MIKDFDYKEIKSKNEFEEIAQYNKQCEEEQLTYKDLIERVPSYDFFKKRFLNLNPSCTEEDFSYIFRKKKGVLYVNFNKVKECGYKMPDGDCLGITLLEKKKFFKKDIIEYLKTDNNKHQFVYQTLPTNIIGAIPVDADKYVLVGKRKFETYNIIKPVVFIYVFIKFLQNLIK